MAKEAPHCVIEVTLAPSQPGAAPRLEIKLLDLRPVQAAQAAQHSKWLAANARRRARRAAKRAAAAGANVVSLDDWRRLRRGE